jgi:hypothetical protein
MWGDSRRYLSGEKSDPGGLQSVPLGKKKKFNIKGRRGKTKVIKKEG